MKKIQLFALTFFAVVVFFEGYLKSARITPPLLKYYNDTFGALNRIDINYMKAKEGLFIGGTNYDGRFRENYPPRKKHSRILRIALIGDSFVEGIDVFSRNHFGAIMEKEIAKILGVEVEVLNFGRGNCTLTNSAYYFEQHIKPNYDADIVLYFTEFRDINVETNYPSTSFIYDTVSKTLIANDSWKQSAEYGIHKKLAGYPVLGLYEELAFTRLGYRAMSGIQMAGPGYLTLGKFWGKTPEQTYEYEKRQGKISETSKKVYDTLKGYSKGQVIFVVRNLPMDASVIMKYFDGKKYPYINLSDTLNKQLIEGTEINAHFFKTTQSFGGHWNHAGHKAVGVFLANRVYSNMKNYKTPNFTYGR